MEITNRTSVIKKYVEPDKLNIFRGVDNRIFEVDNKNITYYIPFTHYYKESDNVYKSWKKRYYFSSKSAEIIKNKKPTPGKNIGCNIHIINCGHGDSILIENRDEYAVIDFGGRDSYRQEESTESANHFAVDKKCDSCIVKYYKNHMRGKKIKTAVITHLHEDHIFDIDKVSQNFEIENLYMLKTYHGEKFKGKNNYKLLDKARADVINFVDIEDIKNRTVEPFKVGFAKFEIIGPVEDSEDLNGNSLVLLMTYNNMKVLFTGDMTKKAERSIIDHCRLNNINLKDISILKVAHHGSDTSSSKPFLNELGDNLTSLISSGIEDKCKQTEKLREKGIVYNTSVDGTVNIKLLPKVKGYIVDTDKTRSFRAPKSLLKNSRVLGIVNRREKDNLKSLYSPAQDKFMDEGNYAF